MVLNILVLKILQLLKIGEKIMKNYEMGAYYYYQCANSGEHECQRHLGGLYFNGQGVEKNYIEAYKWYKLSIPGVRSSETDENITVIQATLVPEDIAYAEKMIADFKASEKPKSTD